MRRKQKGLEAGAAFSSLHEQGPVMPHITLAGHKNTRENPFLSREEW